MHSKPLIITVSYIVVTIIAILAVIWQLNGTITGYLHNRLITDFPDQNALILTTFLASGCMLVIWALSRFFARHYGGWFLLFSILISIPKVILAIRLPIHPVSDMYSYNVLATSWASGDSWQWMNHVGILDLDSISPHVLHIATFDGFLFKLTTTTPLITEGFNIICVILCATLIVSLAQRFFTRTVGFFSAIIFLLMPNWYFYSSLIGVEPVWLLFQLLGLYFIIRILTSDWQWTSLRFWGVLILAVICLFVAKELRPLTLIIVIAVVILGMFKVPILPEFTGGLTPNQTLTRQYFWKPRLAILLIFGLFFGLNQVSTTIDRSIYQVPIANSSIGLKYTLAVGTDPKTHGMYSPQLINQLEKPNHNHKLSSQQKFAEFDQILSRKLLTNRHGLIAHHQTSQVITTKNEELMDPNYGIVLLDMNTNQPISSRSLIAKSLVPPVTTISTAVQLNILFLVLIGLSIQLIPEKTSQLQQRRQNGVLLCALILVGFTLIFMAVEVHSRYQISFYIPWVLLAGVGMNGLALLNERLIR